MPVNAGECWSSRDVHRDVHSTAVARIRSLALVLRSQKTCVIPLSMDPGVHFYPGKWQGLKFSLKEVNDLLKAVLTLKEV